MHHISKNNNAVFIGQTVSYPGSLIFSSLSKVSKDKRIELPLFEETQMGIAIGLSLSGFMPVCCYSRFDFFILALTSCLSRYSFPYCFFLAFLLALTSGRLPYSLDFALASSGSL